MKNSTFSLSSTLVVTLALTFVAVFVLNQLDWNTVNASIASRISGGNDVENTAKVYTNTKMFVADESLYMVLDTATYAYAIYDNAGITTGEVVNIDWVNDTMQLHLDRMFTVNIVDNAIVGIEE